MNCDDMEIINPKTGRGRYRIAEDNEIEELDETREEPEEEHKETLH